MKRTKWSCFQWDKYKDTIIKKRQIYCLFVIENNDDGTAELYDDTNKYPTGHAKIFDIQIQEKWKHKFIRVVAIERERYQQLKKIMSENRVGGLYRTIPDFPFEFALGDPVVIEP